MSVSARKRGQTLRLSQDARGQSVVGVRPQIPGAGRNIESLEFAC